jgi:hypothetical protein
MVPGGTLCANGGECFTNMGPRFTLSNIQIRTLLPGIVLTLHKWSLIDLILRVLRSKKASGQLSVVSHGVDLDVGTKY